MIESVRDIKTEMVEIVRSNCPIAPVFQERGFEYDERCAKCNFLFAPHRCGWDEYETKLVSKQSCTDDDPYGGMPSTGYSRKIQCAVCGGDIVFSSGFSWFGFRDSKYCPECGTYHMYLRGGINDLVFAIPKIREE